MMRLGLAPALLLLWSTTALGADAPAQGSNAGTLSNPLAAQTMEGLSAIVDRPLFSPSRRGAPTAAIARDVDTRTPPPPPPNLVLSGVVMDGASARVVVLLGPERKIVRAEIGDDIGGWKVNQISGRELVLSLDGRFATYTLFNRDLDQRSLGNDTAPANIPQHLQQQKQSPSSASKTTEK